MSNRDLSRIVDLLECEGYEARVYAGYSGRGMYGREVDAITTDCPTDQMQNILGENGFDTMRVDNLGKNLIYY